MTLALADIDLESAIPAADDEIWYTRCPVPTAFELALHNGYFDEEFAESGLKFLPIAAAPDPATHHSHFTHRKANSFRHGGNIPAIYARATGADTKVIGISWPRTSYAVLTQPGSGIESAADLKGKRLLVPVRDDVEIDFWRASTIGVYEKALKSAGLTFDDVDLVEKVYPPHRMPGNGQDDDRGRRRWIFTDSQSFQKGVLVPLVSGEADVVTSQAYMVTELNALTGAKVVWDQADQPDLLDRVNNGAPDALTVSGRFAEEHPERVARVVARLLQAAEWAKGHPEAAIDAFSRRLLRSEMLLEATYGDELSRRLDVDLPPETVDVLEHEQDLLFRHGFIPERFDTASWIDPKPLELARELLSRGEAGRKTNA
jgi:ABC-type nitrate/sulfonate/bicarbonate transport system substrate-binding protein